MPRIPYQWDSRKPATIKDHSVAKLDVLRAYLLEYFQTLVAPHHDELRLTLVDGFAGGGIYEHETTRQEVLGSPFVFLQAAEEAEAIINQGRQKPFRINADYWFVDEDPTAMAVLETMLRARDYAQRIGNDVRLLQGRFDAVAEIIRASIKQKNPRNGRALFFLDQYGYKEVPAPLINSIFREMPAAEVILTFNIDAFINFATDNKATGETLHRIGTPNALRGRSIDEIKRNEKIFDSTSRLAFTRTWSSLAARVSTLCSSFVRRDMVTIGWCTCHSIRALATS
jgi:three-Cys-motif partner protein